MFFDIFEICPTLLKIAEQNDKIKIWSLHTIPLFLVIKGDNMYNNILLIPALNPDDRFIEYVKQLRDAGFYRIVAVDDGSREDLKYIFNTFLLR